MENKSHLKHCPKCGKENPDNAQHCHSCGNALTQAPATQRQLDVKISVLATASFICALFGLALLMPTFIGMSYPRSRLISSEWVSIAFLSGVLVLGVTIILGVSSFIRIEKSGGRMTGGSFAIGAVLVSIFGALLLLLWPIFGSRKRGLAYRMVCGINLSDLGKAMLIYAGDYDEIWPFAGGTNSTWAARIPDWKADNPFEAFDLQADKSDSLLVNDPAIP